MFSLPQDRSSKIQRMQTLTNNRGGEIAVDKNGSATRARIIPPTTRQANDEWICRMLRGTRCSRLHALQQGRLHVTTDDVKAVAKPVLRHRIMTTFTAASQGVTPDVVIERLLKFVPVELHERARKRVQANVK